VRTEILAAAARHGATNVQVFGSVARGDADVASDVDFLESVERIEAQAARGRAAFAADEVAQTAVVRWVETIGEAARGLTEELRRAHPKLAAQVRAIVEEMA
jgi:Nucleotidyltransferase domain